MSRHELDASRSSAQKTKALEDDFVQKVAQFSNSHLFVAAGWQYNFMDWISTTRAIQMRIKIETNLENSSIYICWRAFCWPTKVVYVFYVSFSIDVYCGGGFCFWCIWGWLCTGSCLFELWLFFCMAVFLYFFFFCLCLCFFVFVFVFMWLYFCIFIYIFYL